MRSVQRVTILFKDKGFDRIRQFGWRAALLQLLEVPLRPVRQVNDDINMICPDRPELCANDYPDVKPLTLEILYSNQKKWMLNEKVTAKLNRFLNTGCQGFMIEKEGKIAGYAFIQETGVYPFGGDGRFNALDKFSVLKNQYVFRDFRGQRLTFQFNAARTKAVAENKIPIGFVIPENKYSIRSLKKHGFIEVLKIQRITWLRLYTKQNIKILQHHKLNGSIIKGLTH
jgi:hypothetical protein